MRFIFNRFPDDPDFHPDEKWTGLKEPTDLWTTQLKAIPFMIFNGALIIVLMGMLGIHFELNMTTMLISFLIFSPIHELIHALFFPEKLTSSNVWLGFTVNGFAPFAAYLGEMKRNTFIRVLLAPFVIISAVGLLFLFIFGSNSLVEHILVFNAVGACADMLGVYYILTQVPRYAYVRNKKIRTFWRITNP
ncbi:hypothetical protein PbJCM13498_03280 [Prolixibacter bellariivorans]|uniref:DUF3267 domain-containing protein n=1 Tax=Prolixibacter bellariivorans TaxID=314319 RepID=A0A5M4AU53_9BACT|nr:DUF3267 domain-containing protein [Prolixibacter bellariivorans]GET31465.1 hypothetical protein PbJCM13498_03280 [Prolixibacter bellariivorans]